MYYSDLLISDYIIEIHISYWLILFTLMLVSFAYPRKINQYFPNRLYSAEHPKSLHTRNIKRDYTTILFWIASLPAILAQIYMIQMFDGLPGYVVAAKWGTKFFHGLGPLKYIQSTKVLVFCAFPYLRSNGNANFISRDIINTISINGANNSLCT